MIPEFIRGCIAPVFTAFHEDESLDDDGQRAILDFLADTGAVSAGFVRCGLGQMFTFSYEDVKQIAKASCEHMAGRLPILVGCGGIWDRDREKYPDPEVYVRQAVELSQYAESVGATGIVHMLPEAVVPQGNETPLDVLMRYFETVSSAVKIPTLIYQSPGTDERYCLDVESVARVADMPNVMGMKLSSSDARYIADLCWATRDKDFGFIVGAETAFLPGLVCGARAVIGQGATINPKILKAIQERYDQGDLRGALDAQRATNFLVERARNCTEFFKRWLAEMGYAVKPVVRGPGGNAYAKAEEPLSQEEYETYKELLESELAKY